MTNDEGKKSAEEMREARRKEDAHARELKRVKDGALQKEVEDKMALRDKFK